MVSCRGCGGSFTNAGWSNHLAQTKDWRCIAARNEDEAAELAVLAASTSIPSSSAVHPPPLSDFEQPGDALEPEDVVMDVPGLPDFDLDDPPLLFASDHFGMYSSDDYDDYDSSASRPGSPSPSTSDDSEFSDGEGDGWEPPPESVNLDDTALDSHLSLGASPAIPLPSENAASTSVDRAEVEAEVAAKTHVVQYSKSALAGAPIPGAMADQDGHTRYGGGLSAGDHSTGPVRPIYWPFSSKLDWEVARWGKKRGPGSTALTELLEIDGVRLSNTYITSIVQTCILGR